MSLFKWPLVSKIMHVQKRRYTRTQCRGTSVGVDIESNDLPSTHLNPINTPSCEQLWQIFIFSTLSSQEFPCYHFPIPNSPWAPDTCTSAGLSKPEKPLPTIPSQSPCPRLGLCLSSLHFWNQLFQTLNSIDLLCKLSLMKKRESHPQTEATYANTLTQNRAGWAFPCQCCSVSLKSQLLWPKL